MMGGVKVRARQLPSGRITWQLDLGVVDGRRVQRSYATRPAAEKAMRQAKQAHTRHGGMAKELSGAVMAEMVLARERLRQAGATLQEAVAFFMQHGGRLREQIPVADLVRRFIASRMDASERYRRQLRVSLESLARHCGARNAAEVTQAEVEAWLGSGGWSAKTRNNYRGDVSACFAWAIKKGLARFNPAAEIEKARLGDEEIGTLTVEQCAVLLRGALKHARSGDASLIGFCVLGLFGGLRPAEIQRLDWQAVKLEERVVIVEGRKAKTRRRRVVDLSENAVAWLKAGVPVLSAGPICGRWWDARWRMFRRELGWRVGKPEKRMREAAVAVVFGEWPHNALRHTFASMHYALHQDEAKLQALMGHESAGVLHRHYRALTTSADARAFWDLRPD